jgi:outer membrane protein
MKKIIQVILILLCINSLRAQKVLTAQDAINIALKNNYDILVAQNDADMDKINNTAGNAGILPSVSLNASDNYSIFNVYQKLADGTTSSSSGSKTNSLNANVALSWTLFDGGKMFITKRKLDEYEKLGELQFKERVLQTVYNVISAYYNIVKQKQLLQSLNKVFEYNQERVNILQTGFNAGLTPKNNLLQAKIDLNVNHENSFNQKTLIIASKRALNQLIVMNIDSVSFDVEDTILIPYKPDKEDLMKKIYTSNISVLSQQKQIDISNLVLKENQKLRFPKINLNSSYGFQQYDYSTGSFQISRNIGPQIGGSISVPLFQGGNINRQINLAKLQVKSTEYQLENVKQQVNTTMLNALTDFENQSNLLAIEQENSQLARENLEIAMQRLRLGQSTALEVRIAQQSFEDSMSRLISIQYNLKLAETKIKQLIAVN